MVSLFLLGFTPWMRAIHSLSDETMSVKSWLSGDSACSGLIKLLENGVNQRHLGISARSGTAIEENFYILLFSPETPLLWAWPLVNCGWASKLVLRGVWWCPTCLCPWVKELPLKDTLSLSASAEIWPGQAVRVFNLYKYSISWRGMIAATWKSLMNFSLFINLYLQSHEVAQEASYFLEVAQTQWFSSR